MSQSEAPLVSVVTPCYNAGRFVAETIASVRAQSYSAVEHVIIDDHSTDASWAVIEAHGDAVVASRLAENRGGGHARNRGAELARGEYLMFLDADDTIAPGTLEALVAAARSKPETIAYCDWARLRASDGSWTVEAREMPLPAEGYDPLCGWLEGVWVPTCSILWPRLCYEKTGGWDESLLINQDGDIMLRALADGAGLTRAAGGCGYYRDHGSERLSISGSAFSEPQFRSLIRVLEKLTADLERRGKLEAYQESLGVAYQRLALGAARQGQYELAREYATRGERFAGRRAISRTPAGRLLTWLVGVERKERLVTALAEHGIGTAARKRSMRLRRVYAAGGAIGSGGGERSYLEENSEADSRASGPPAGDEGNGDRGSS